MYIHSFTFLQFHSKHRTFEYLKKKKKQLHDMFCSLFRSFLSFTSKISPHTHSPELKRQSPEPKISLKKTERKLG